MKYFDLYASYPDHTIAAAWESQMQRSGQDFVARRHFNGVWKRAVCALRGALRGAARLAAQRAARTPASTCTFQRTGRDLAGILTAGRTTTTASDGLVLGRCRAVTGAGAGSSDGGHDHCHHNRSQHRSGWPMFADRSHRQRQQRCSDVPRLRQGQRSRHDCPAGECQRDTQCYTTIAISAPRVCL